MTSNFILLAMFLLCCASSAVWAQQGTTPPKVERIIPDVSEKVPTDLKEIRVVFSEKMTGVDIEFTGVPLGDFELVDNGKVLVIPFNQPLSPSKIYRLILGGSGGL